MTIDNITDKATVLLLFLKRTDFLSYPPVFFDRTTSRDAVPNRVAFPAAIG